MPCATSEKSVDITNLLSAVNARKEIYAGIPELAARIVRAVAASEGSAETVKDVRSIKRRLVPNADGRKPNRQLQRSPARQQG